MTADRIATVLGHWKHRGPHIYTDLQQSSVITLIAVEINLQRDSYEEIQGLDATPATSLQG